MTGLSRNPGGRKYKGQQKQKDEEKKLANKLGRINIAMVAYEGVFRPCSKLVVGDRMAADRPCSDVMIQRGPAK